MPSTAWLLLAVVTQPAHSLLHTPRVPSVTTSGSSSISASRRQLVVGASAGVAQLALGPFPAGADLAGARAGVQWPEMGIGAWAWGDELFWGKSDPEQIREAFNYCVSNGVDFFDTAEVYGFGKSEKVLRKLAEESGRPIRVASKFAAVPWRTKREDVVKACRASLQRLGADQMELYQIHFPNAWANEDYWDGLADCYELGLVGAVGVSNYGSDAVRAVKARLAARNIPLASNQIQYSLLYPFANQNGLKETCDELGVKVLAYSPLGQGLITGKYSTEASLPSGPRKGMAQKYLEEPGFAVLESALKSVASKHSRPQAQVALNWCRAKGTVPIPGARTLAQAKSNVMSLQWRLDTEDVQLLDAATSNLPRMFDGSPFPKEDINTKLQFGPN